MGEGCICVSTINMETGEKGSEGCLNICERACVFAMCVCVFSMWTLFNPNTMQRSQGDKNKVFTLC